jgi:siroheme synthase-like protein
MERGKRRIPEATVARLPVYLRSLLELAEDKTSTISSERLAEMAGVNAAKVRKDLSYLGSYGTRGVGYDVEYLLFQVSRELGLTHDWPVVIVGIGNLGAALTNYAGFSERGFPVAALVDADPRNTGCRRPTGGRPPRRSRHYVDPELRAGRHLGPRRGVAAESGPGARTADPELLSPAQGARVERRGPGQRRQDGGRLALMPVEQPLYPVNLLVAGRRCLVVGGGPVAAQKAQGLVDCEAVVHVIASEVGEAIRAIPTITWDERPYRSGDVGGYRLVITATDDPVTNRQVFSEADEAGIWVNSADDPANCSFTLPSRVRQGPLLVTFATGGRSPAVATWLRRRFEVEFGPEYLTLIEILGEQRARVQAEGRSTEGLDWQKALDSGMLELIREGHLAEAKERLQACLSSSSD